MKFPKWILRLFGKHKAEQKTQFVGGGYFPTYKSQEELDKFFRSLRESRAQPPEVSPQRRKEDCHD